MIQTLEWTDHGVRFIDQTKLPTEEVYVNCTTHQQVADVIRNMVVRGAPAIGVAAAMGVALGVKNSKAESGADLHSLRQHFRGFLTVHDASGKPLLFRYYDPRVLRTYLPTCSGEELNTMFGPVDAYLMEDESGAALLRFRLKNGTLAKQVEQVS